MSRVHPGIVLLVFLGLSVMETRAQTTLPPPVDRTASKEALKKKNEAQAEVRKAEANVQAVIARLRGSMPNPELTKAQAELKQAALDMETARQRVVEDTRKKPEHQKLVQDKLRIDKQKEDLRADPGADSNKLMELANQSLAVSAAITKMETDAVASDPKYADARKRSTDAAARIKELEQQFLESIKDNEQLVEAQKKVDEAREKAKLAEDEHAQAVQREAEAEKQRRQQIAQQRKSGTRR